MEANEKCGNINYKPIVAYPPANFHRYFTKFDQFVEIPKNSQFFPFFSSVTKETRSHSFLPDSIDSQKVRIFGGILQNPGCLDSGIVNGFQTGIEGFVKGPVHKALQQRSIHEEIPLWLCIVWPADLWNIFPEGLTEIHSHIPENVFCLQCQLPVIFLHIVRKFPAAIFLFCTGNFLCFRPFPEPFPQQYQRLRWQIHLLPRDSQLLRAYLRYIFHPFRKPLHEPQEIRFRFFLAQLADIFVQVWDQNIIFDLSVTPLHRLSSQKSKCRNKGFPCGNPLYMKPI